MLAILKAGAGYVPIDADYPPERIAYLLQDSDPIAVLAQAGAYVPAARAKLGLVGPYSRGY